MVLVDVRRRVTAATGAGSGIRDRVLSVHT